MYLKKIIDTIAPPTCSRQNAKICKIAPPPASSSYCGRDPDRALQLLNAFEKQQHIPWRTSQKCAHVVKEQYKMEATFKCREMFVNALEALNKALCFAPNDTESVGILYANRAKVLAQMKLYEEAVDSIHLALENNYPEGKRMDLEELRDDYLSRICGCGCEDDCAVTKKKFRVTLSYPACPRNPSVIQAMHVETDCQYGRHLVADRDLKVGDVICVEKPFVICIQPEQRYKRCTHCLREVPHLLRPCTGCTNAMFCSEECRTEADERYHAIECQISDELMDNSDDVGRLAMRIFLFVIQKFDGDIMELKKYLKQNAGRKISPFEVDHRIKCSTELFLSQFLAYYNGNCVDAQLSDCAKASLTQQVARLATLLSQKCIFAEQLQCDKLKVFLMELFYHFICVNRTNSFEVGSPSMDHRKVPTSLGIFLCMSMASHSCSPNVVRLRVGDSSKLMWVVTHFIPKGGQIFDNYGAFFMTQPKCVRQQWLKEHYGFDCDCEACAMDYPLAPDLPEPCDVPQPGESYLNGCGELTISRIKAELRAVKDFIMKYECQFPCQQLRKAEIRLVELFKVATSDETLETRFPEYTTHNSFEQLLDQTDPWDVVVELGNII